MTKQADQNWRNFIMNSLPRMESATSLPAPSAADAPISFGFIPQQGFDPISLLPPTAADRLRALRQRAADAHALVPEFESIREASGARTEAANALRRLTDAAQDRGFNLPDDDRRVVAAEQHLAKMTADFERLRQLQEVRQAAFQTVSAAKANVEGWFRDGRPHGTVLQEFETPEVKLAKGESVLDGIDRLRRRGRELKAAIHTIQSAPFPSSHAKRQMRSQIEQMAQRGAPSVSLLIEHDRDIAWATQQAQSTVYNTGTPAIAFAEMPDAVALFAWVHKDALIQRLDAEIDAEADDKAALTHEARQIRTAEVMGDLLAVERDESALVWRAQSDGLPVEHRADISPLALLGLRLVTAPTATSSPVSSPEHSTAVVFGGRR